MPGMFGNDPPLLLIAAGLSVAALIVFAFMTAGD